ncbi:CoA transferase [Teichococcus aestuarii]|uniref:CoA transferase n=1 Tax=Teichococcus aestuarii TaxID=568898 RepID=UPI00360FAB1B
MLERLVPTADVLVENFAPGTMERLGLGWEHLRTLNPRLVYCALKGYLPGPYEDLPALDEVVQMQGGLAHMTGLPGRPLRAGTSVVDIMGGVFGVVGILAALRQREATGEGQKVQAALFESVAFMVGQHMAAGAIAGSRVPPMTARRITWAIYDVFTAADGQVFVGVTSDQHWQRLCAQFGLEALGADPSLATNGQRVAARDRIMPELERIFGAMTVAEVLERCRAARIPCAPVAHPEDLFDDPHLAASGIMGETALSDTLRAALPMTPLRFETAGITLRQQPPRIGEGGGGAGGARPFGGGDRHAARRGRADAAGGERRMSLPPHRDPRGRPARGLPVREGRDPDRPQGGADPGPGRDRAEAHPDRLLRRSAPGAGHGRCGGRLPCAAAAAGRRLRRAVAERQGLPARPGGAEPDHRRQRLRLRLRGVRQAQPEPRPRAGPRRRRRADGALRREQHPLRPRHGDGRLRLQLPGRGAGERGDRPHRRHPGAGGGVGLPPPVISLADTMAWATPRRIAAVVGAVREKWPELEISLHLHDTRGMAMVNAWEGMRLGVARFDAAIAGLGGCPFAKHAGAAGNICTEDRRCSAPNPASRQGWTWRS